MSSTQTQTIRLSGKTTDSFDRFIEKIDRLEHGSLEIRTQGRVYRLNGEHPGPAGDVEIHRLQPLLKRLFIKGGLGLAESYIEGDWDSSDLSSLLLLLLRNQHRLEEVSSMSRLARLAMRWYHWSRRNTRKGSARNIMDHYDLGNAFYAQWLDPGMTYSSGIFNHQDENLADAQTNKYLRILQLLDAKPGDRILEIGCGWGGFAISAAQRGLQVDAVTLSPAQLAWAQRRVEALKLEGQIKLSLQDYRHLSGSYDHIVSIEMFEAVGEAYWSTYMQAVQRLLKPGGRAALQVITIDEKAFEDYRRNPDFIQRYIFPGGMLPPTSHLLRHAGSAGLRCLQDASFGLDYAKTLQHWHVNFKRESKTIQALGYDERFRRMWRYYLSYCEAGFLAGHIDLHQVLLDNPG
jgi:cyclopropane-fatty-acyl-phospholipid synthase